MGLIKAAVNATTGAIADQWIEFFYCDAIDSNTLAVKGRKKVSSRSSNNGDDNVITDGSTISVNEGQCMIIVEQGKVVEVAAEPGEYKFDSKTQPSVFAGTFGEGLRLTFQQIGKRFTYGGIAPTDQRVYYFNTKEIIGNKYGTASPVPFRVVDRNIGLDIDISIRCNGEFSYKIIDPMLFYTNVCGNFQGAFTRDKLDSILKTELLTALQPAFAKISSVGVRYSELPGHTLELSQALNEVLSAKWSGLRGIAISSFGINSITASQEDEDMIKQAQRAGMLRNTDMAAATLVDAQAQAMRDAAKNEGGSMVGFMGLNAAQQAGGANAQSLFQLGANAQPAATGWTCQCGQVNSAKFCSNCGLPKPAPANTLKCANCGALVEDASKPPKFCPECGTLFKSV